MISKLSKTIDKTGNPFDLRLHVTEQNRFKLLRSPKQGWCYTNGLGELFVFIPHWETKEISF